jgi:pyruvate dehydrogenase E1 component beta subunit
MAVLTMVDAIRTALADEMERDERMMIFGEDVGRLGGVFRATDGLQARFGADRVVDTPLAEGAIAGTALGLAVAGMTPVAEIQFLGFAHQAYHQIVDQIARYRYRSRGHYPLPLTIRAPFGGGVRTPELHSDAVEAHYTHAPGLKVAMPATAHDAKGLLLTAIRDPDPVLFCEPLRGYRLVKDEVPEGDYTVPFGQARVARAGDDVTLVAWSASVQLCERAAEIAAAEHEVSCEVVDLRTLVPLDVATVVASVERTGRAVVVQESALTGGFAGEIVATIQEEAFYSLEAPVARVGAPDTPYPPFVSVERYYVPDETRVVAAILSTVGIA